MTQVFDDAGRALPVTVLQAGPCRVLQLRTVDRDGYEAMQIGFLDKPRRLASRSERGHVAALGSKRSKKQAEAGKSPVPKADCEPQRFVREIRGAVDGVSVGDEVTVAKLEGIKAVDVVGVTKGRGFQGVMKRWGFKGQRATHGVKKVHRHAGSYGCRTDPGRIFKGRKMPGHYGVERVTIRNLKIVRVDAENNLLLVYGAVPGPTGAMVVIRETNKKR
ncbi:MAG: 50S ribosomal protein L3 [Pirellulales bacterium]